MDVKQCNKVTLVEDFGTLGFLVVLLALGTLSGCSLDGPNDNKKFSDFCSNYPTLSEFNTNYLKVGSTYLIKEQWGSVSSWTGTTTAGTSTVSVIDQKNFDVSLSSAQGSPTNHYNVWKVQVTGPGTESFKLKAFSNPNYHDATFSIVASN